MKAFLLVLTMSTMLFAVGCGATTRESSEEERKAGESQMQTDMQTMMQSIPQNPGAGQQPTGGTGTGTGTTP